MEISHLVPKVTKPQSAAFWNQSDQQVYSEYRYILYVIKYALRKVSHEWFDQLRVFSRHLQLGILACHSHSYIIESLLKCICSTADTQRSYFLFNLHFIVPKLALDVWPKSVCTKSAKLRSISVLLIFYLYLNTSSCR